MDKIAVLIPCYNEEKTIRDVVLDFKKHLPEAKVYVYNNNSTDKTAIIAKAAGAIVRNEFRQGKGNVIRRMFREIDAECYIMVDGDYTYSAKDAKALIDPIFKKNADMVVGDRLSSSYFVENKRPFHNVGNASVRFIINALFRGDIRDILTGYRAFSYNFVKTFPVLSNGFEIETEMSIHAIDKRMNIENITILYKDRPDGSESKLNTYSDGFKVIVLIAKLFRVYKPMFFFGIISAILLLISCAFIIPVLQTYFNTGLVPNFPTLIVCCFVALIGILCFFTGLILQTLRQKEKQDFEKNLIEISSQKKLS